MITRRKFIATTIGAVAACALPFTLPKAKPQLTMATMLAGMEQTKMSSTSVLYYRGEQWIVEE